MHRLRMGIPSSSNTLLMGGCPAGGRGTGFHVLCSDRNSRPAVSRARAREHNVLHSSVGREGVVPEVFLLEKEGFSCDVLV